VTTAGDAQTWRRHHRPLADDQIGSVKSVTDEAQGGYTQRSHKLLEIIAVLILGITTVGTAWCGYQASQWNGAQSDLARESSDELVEASRLFGLATQKVSYDSTIIANYAIAVQEGDDQLTEFYRKTLVRPDFTATLDKWIAEVRAGGTPTSLFEDTAYLDQQFADYQTATAKAEKATQASQAAGETANAYVLTTILLAVALFFAGVTSSFRYLPTQAFLLILALGAVAGAALRLADLPVLW